MSYRDTVRGIEELWDDDGDTHIQVYDPIGDPPYVAIHAHEGRNIRVVVDCAHPDSIEALGLKFIHKARLLRKALDQPAEPDEDTFFDHLRRRAGLRRAPGGEGR